VCVRIRVTWPCWVLLLYREIESLSADCLCFLAHKLSKFSLRSKNPLRGHCLEKKTSFNLKKRLLLCSRWLCKRRHIYKSASQTDSRACVASAAQVSKKNADATLMTFLTHSGHCWLYCLSKWRVNAPHNTGYSSSSLWNPVWRMWRQFVAQTETKWTSNSHNVCAFWTTVVTVLGCRGLILIHRKNNSYYLVIL